MRTQGPWSIILLVLATSSSGVGCGDQAPESGSTSASASGAGGTGAGGIGATSGSGGASSGSGGASAGSGGATSGSGGSMTTTTGTSMSTPCTGATCDLKLVGAGFDAVNGLTLRAGIIPQGTQKGFTWSGSATVMGGAFSVEGVGALTKGTSYFLNYYVDKNQDGKCEINPTDDVYRIPVPAVTDNVTFSVTQAMNLSNIGCGGF